MASVVEYLENDLAIQEEALKSYEPRPIEEVDAEVRIMKQKEVIRINNQIMELKRYIAVIKLIT